MYDDVYYDVYHDANRLTPVPGYANACDSQRRSGSAQTSPSQSACGQRNLFLLSTWRF